MNQQEYNQLREAGWRRPLTPLEEAELHKYLAANPTGQADWQAEMELNRLLERLPEAPPVASNFTARVLKAVELEAAVKNRERSAVAPFWMRIRGWLPRAAVAALVAGTLIGGNHLHQVSERATLAKNVVGLAQAVSSDAELMKDFEPIREMGNSQPAADTELLALMK
jgi:negative regulator of sigma E activity